MACRLTLLTVCLATALQTGCGQPAPAVASAPGGALHAAASGLPAITLSGPMRLLASAKANIEAPRQSPNNQWLAYVVAEDVEVPGALKRLIGVDPNTPTERTTAWLTGMALDPAQAAHRFAGRTFKNVVEPSFTPDGRALIYCVQKHVPVITRGKALEEMRLDRYDIATGHVETVYEGPLSLLHPMYSPNGRFIAAYARNIAGRQGLYVLDVTKPGAEPIQVTAGDHKHPVWSANGQSLFFHSQAGGDAHAGAGAEESAWIGRVDVTDLAHPRLTMLDDVKDASIYHKHPTPLPGTDLILYHAASHNSDNWLEVMNMRTHQRARLAVSGMSPAGKPLGSFKHPQISADGQSLVLVARPAKRADKAVKSEAYAVYLLGGLDRVVKAFN